MPTQLLLPFPRNPSYDAVDLILSPSNKAVVCWLNQGWWPDNRLAIWGPPGCGKTHIVTIWARRHDVIILQGAATTSIDALPATGTVVIDNAEQIPGDHLMLHLLNTARDRDLRILLLSRTPPSHWEVKLPDLSSRLRAITAVAVLPPDDDLLQALLVRMLAERQIDLAPQIRAWMLLNLQRSAQVLGEAVACLDEESLRSSAPITRAWAERILVEHNLVPARMG